MALMEAIWCIPLFLAFSPAASRLPTSNIAVYVLANLLVAVGLLRAITHLHVQYNVYRWIVLGGIVAACTLDQLVFLPLDASSVPLIIRSLSARSPGLLPAPVMAAGAITFLWYRGIRVATTVVTPVRASFGFRLGILIMLGMCLVPDARLQSDLITLLPLFFFAGLLATAVARAASLRINRDAQRSTFGGRWLGFTGALGVLVSAVGFLIALLLAGYGVEGAARILRGILGALFVVFLVVVTPLLYVLEWLLRPIAQMIQSLTLNFNSPALQNQFTQVPGDPTNAERLRQLAMLLDVLKYLCLGLIILGVIAGLFLLLRNRARNQGIEGEEHEDLESEGLLDSLRSLLRRGLGGLQNALGSLQGPGLNLLNALTIRRLYARLLARATELGFPRDQAETPFEYQAKLRSAFPGFPDEIESVTRAYVNVHYGEVPESGEALSAVRDAVERMLASVESDGTQARA
jgi:Domain of unknown function (DUF4129)